MREGGSDKKTSVFHERGCVTAEGEQFRLYAGLSTPAVILGPDHRIVYLNPSAEEYWQVKLEQVAGRYPQIALRMSPVDGTAPDEWARAVMLPALASGAPCACRISGVHGSDQVVRVSGTRFQRDGAWFTLLTLLHDSPREEAPEWAVTDPLTGVHNRLEWDRQLSERDRRGGVAMFFDVDNLKEINDLHGHRRGDQALVASGRVIRRHAPDGALAVRYGGDEFVMVVHGVPEAKAREFAERIAQSVVLETGGNVHLSYGLAAYGPGGLLAAVDSADEDLYAQKGVLLRAKQGGRIVLTTEGRGKVLPPGSDAVKSGPGEYSSGFGSQFDAHFRQMYARAVEQAREFVEFVGPESGSAVVEVGAGSGRITFDGGLAERIGAQGQLLVTDPSVAQLQVARQRGESLGLSWVRFLAAAVEHLPLGSNTVDLAVGSTFLHFTDESAAVRSMARIVRPGGRVAIHAGLAMRWGPAWRRAFGPIWSALRERGQEPREVFLPRADLEALVVGAGLVLERSVVVDRDQVEYPNAEIAVAVARSARLAGLQARQLPAEVRGTLEDGFEAEFRQAIEELTPQAAGFDAEGLYILARKPG